MSLLLEIMQRIFPRLLLMHILRYLFGSYLSPLLLIWGDQSLVPNIGEYARAKDDAKER